MFHDFGMKSGCHRCRFYTFRFLFNKNLSIITVIRSKKKEMKLGVQKPQKVVEYILCINESMSVCMFI